MFGIKRLKERVEELKAIERINDELLKIHRDMIKELEDRVSNLEDGYMLLNSGHKFDKGDTISNDEEAYIVNSVGVKSIDNWMCGNAKAVHYELTNLDNARTLYLHQHKVEREMNFTLLKKANEAIQ